MKELKCLLIGAGLLGGGWLCGGLLCGWLGGGWLGGGWLCGWLIGGLLGGVEDEAWVGGYGQGQGGGCASELGKGLLAGEDDAAYLLEGGVHVAQGAKGADVVLPQDVVAIFGGEADGGDAQVTGYKGVCFEVSFHRGVWCGCALGGNEKN